MSTSKLTAETLRGRVIRATVLGVAGMVTLGLATPGSAMANNNSAHAHGAGHGGAHAPAHAAPKPAKGKTVFLTAELNGANEVPPPDGKPVGDKDGSGTALIQIKGDRLTFALKWNGVSQLTLGHIHEGAAGVNGGVKVPLFGTAMPTTITAAAGQVTVTDANLATQLTTNPAGFYVNLHSTEFAAGALRGQLKLSPKPVNVLSVVQGGKLRGLGSGDQEVPVPNGPAVGDPDGQMITFLQPKADSVNFSLAWIRMGAPTLGHIHKGKFGTNGAVHIPLFGSAVPDTIFAVSGVVPNLDPALVSAVVAKPTDFYSNLHNLQFPGGALRAQLFG